MKNATVLIAILSILGAAPAIAQNEGGGQPSGKRPLVACMSKQMAASRTLSYNDAARLCRERARDPQPAAAGTTPASPGPKPGS